MDGELARLFETQEQAERRRADRCYQSFSGYVCGGCNLYHVCKMAERDNKALARIVRIMEGNE